MKVEIYSRGPRPPKPEKEEPSYAKASEGEGGAGGSRTRVQTRKLQAFYMLISDLIFE